MTYSSIIRSTAVGLVAAAVLAGSAFAGGEPKNQWPFTRSVGDRATAAATKSQAGPQIQGEPKNEAPFTRPATMVVASSGSGFSWTDGGIGAVAGVGIALSGAGALLVARRAPRTA